MKRSDYIKYLWLLILAIPIATVLILLREEAFRFEFKEYLWLLGAIAPMLILFLLFQYWRKKNLDRFANSYLLAQLTPDISFNKHLIKFILLSLAFEFMVIGFANPQVGTRQEKIMRKGIDVIIALDVSNSMLGEDVKPNRLMRAKNFISNFIDTLKNDRVGMIAFAGKASLQMPITTDYGAARMYLKTISTDLITYQGTDIAEAIQMAQESFPKEGTPKSKALIIITDGEDNEGGTDEALQKITKQGVKVFTLGVGTDNGGPIPEGSNFKRDNDGNIVLSKINQKMLREIAVKGNGKYFQLGSGKDEIEAIFKELGGISKKEMNEMVFTAFDSKFQYCLAIAAMLLLLEWWITERKLKFSF